jgi:hypothetical protein
MTTIPIVTKVTYVVNEIVGKLVVPLWETDNYLDAVAEIARLRKKYPYVHKFKMSMK